MTDTAAPNPHDELAKELAEGWIRETGCDPVAAEIRADMDMGHMHDAGTCPVCLELDKPRQVKSFDDLTGDEVEICREISRQEYLLTSLPANGGTDEAMAACVKERYNQRLALVRSLNADKGHDWNVESVSDVMGWYDAYQREMALAEAEMEQRYGL